MKEQIKKILDGFAHQYYNIIQAVNNGYTVAFTRIGTDTYADQITALCEAECQARVERLQKSLDELWVRYNNLLIGE